MATKLYQMTPKEIVAELDKYIIGQDEAKKSVAIALRNRYRRSLLSEKMQEEITPKNILMMGPTGVGKTEIARSGTLSKARERADGYKKPGVRLREEKKINTINSRKNSKKRDRY